MHGPLLAQALAQLVILLVLGALQLLMPRLTRADLWFSVTIDPSFRASAEAKQIERRYRLIVAAHLVLALALAAWGFSQGALWALPAGCVWLLSGSVAAFVLAHHQAQPFAVRPSSEREALLVRPRAAVPGGFPAQAGPFLLLALAATFAALRWDTLPARIPTHFDAAGQANAWAERSVGSVFGPLFVGAALCLFLVLLPLAVARTRRVHTTGAAGRTESAFRRVTQAILIASAYLVALVFSLLTAVALGGPHWILALLPLLPLVFVLGVVLVSVLVGQGGSRLAPTPADGAPAGDRTKDSAWKGGLFYANREDPALVVEKRFGFGYTLNLAHPVAWIIGLALLLSPLLIRLISRLFA